MSLMSDNEFREKVLVYMGKQDHVNESVRKLLNAHNEELWGTGDDNPGIKSKVKDLTDAAKADKENRVWWRAAISVPVIGLAIDWFVNLFSKTHPPLR
jgi:hypothetical protein